MRIEHYPLDKLKKELTEIIGRHLDLAKYKIFFFGSRVSGKGNDRSDIDVGIEGPNPVGYRVVSEIKEEIEKLPTLYKIDVVDFKEVTDKFRQVAMQKIEYISL